MCIRDSINQLQYQLTEKGVLPGKPGAGEVGCIILMKRFVPKDGTCIRIHKHLDASFDFGIIPACEGFHHNAHGPHLSLIHI